MRCLGIRGAIHVESNSEAAILAAAHQLLSEIVAQNQLDPADLAAVTFTVTKDLTAAYPARAAREMGWQMVPLMCAQEMDVPGSLPACLRVLLLWNTHKTQDQVRHVYLGRARALRPDLVKEEEK
ncbi:chorismate mutase [Ornatilinea apprima]|uniref:chorismate mutase n=1 Tax=Ornatilinea apprima TaxID=1134406 RepID=A0A0P6Y3N7_9CHLR|nr:chorismate mutase [Ornatilinea apprima]KPL79563.1 chorismate mutase [Ornatilinea apprima]